MSGFLTPRKADSEKNGLKTAARVIVVTTAMLTFISFWRAAALVLNDLAGTAYYIGGIAEHNVGPSAPWFILFVMLFAYAVRWLYMESCSMFVRGGAYKIVKEAMGKTMAKVAVSALVFDFILTGPISSVTAGHYIYGFIRNLLDNIGYTLPVSSRVFSVITALIMTGYFWWLNIKGVEESSLKALRILMVTIVMIILLDVWSVVSIMQVGWKLPPFNLMPVHELHDHSLGWLANVPWIKTIGLAAFFVGLGHTLLAMSGEEALAQVYREIEAPKQKNLKRAAFVIFVVSVFFTVFVSFSAYSLVPRETRLAAGDNLLNELVLHLAGPYPAKIAMVAFVVAVGSLILAGAVNTSIFAANGILNRVAEDGIIPDALRTPHHRYGTTSRLIHLIGIAQVITILAAMGDIHILGEAYAFGVIWSFTFMSISMLILRFKFPLQRSIKLPLNFRVKGIEFPLGILLIVLILLGVALINLFTKKIATISGCTFTAAFFILFMVSERINRKKSAVTDEHSVREKFLLETREDLAAETLNLPAVPHRILVPIRDPNNLSHLMKALSASHESHSDIVVMTVKVDKTYRDNQPIRALNEKDTLFNEGKAFFTEEDEYLFSRVIALAELYGERITQIVIPSNNPWFAIAKTAHEIDADEILLGQSEQVPPETLLEQLLLMWGIISTENSKKRTLRVIGYDGEEFTAEFS